MKIIHCADLHLDSRMNTHLSPEQAKERKREMLRTFVRMVDYAQQYEIPIILIAGDLFDTCNISATVRNTVAETIMDHPQIDFLYLRGNHDRDNFLDKMEQIPENLKLFGEDWISYRYGSVVITGKEFGKKSTENFYESLKLDREDYNIVMLHGQINPYQNKDQTEVISINSLKNQNIDYLALGHVHSWQMERLDARGYYCYPGCLEGRGFDECGEKGFVVLNINEKERSASLSFIPAAYRCLYTISVDVTGAESTMDAAKHMEQEIAKARYTNSSLVRFELCGEISVESEIDCGFLEEMFREYFYVVEVKNRTKLYVDYRDYEKDLSLKGEFIRMVMKSDLAEEEKAEVIRCGILALSGEEVVV